MLLEVAYRLGYKHPADMEAELEPDIIIRWIAHGFLQDWLVKPQRVPSHEETHRQWQTENSTLT